MTTRVNRCSFPRVPVTCAGIGLLTIWEVRGSGRPRVSGKTRDFCWFEFRRAERRAANACERLRTGRPTVAEVAGEMGFCDPFHFSKAFRHEYGFPPSAMRGRDGKPGSPAVASLLDSPRLTDPTFDIFPFVA
jgi:hypothetical protein